MLGWENGSIKMVAAKQKPSFIGMKGFGSSGPAKDLFDHFKINVDEICRQVRH